MATLNFAEIPIEDMHYIIFKDKIECYRSAN
jgi:hypothetical protein